MGREIKTVAFGVIGGFVGGLFTAGAFSSLGASFGVALAGYQKPKSTSNFSAPELLPQTGEIFIRQFAGRVGNVQARVIRVGKNKAGDQAGVFVRTSKKSAGKGATTSEAQYFLMVEVEIGRAMGGHDDSPAPLFVDKLEIEDSDGRVCIYDRDGATEEARGLTLVQTTSGITGRVICETSETVRFYTGTDEQLPDPAMAEFYPEGLTGDRGIAKICFNRYPVKSAPTIWVTVRGENSGRRELLTAKFGDVGIVPERLKLEAIPSDSLFKGVSIENFTSVREFAERAARKLFCDWAFDGARLVVQSRTSPTIHLVDTRTLGVWRDAESADDAGDGRLILQARGATEMCSEVRINFPNLNQNYESDIAFSPQPRADWQNALQYDLGEVESMQVATKFAYALRDEDWNSDEQGQFSVLPGSENWLAGDVLRIDRGKAGSVGTQALSLPPRYYLLLEAEREGSGIQNCSVVPWAAHVYTQPIIVVGPVAPEPSIQEYSPVQLLVFDGPVFEDRSPDTRSRPYLVVFVSASATGKWEGTRVLLGKDSADSDAYGSQETHSRAVMGEVVGAWSGETTMAVKTIYGGLVNADEDGLLRGGNLLAFASGLLVQFESATVTDYDPDSDEIFYTLSGVTAGKYGSEPYLADLAPGSHFALARDHNGDVSEGALFYELSGEHKGRPMRATARVIGTNPSVSFTFQAHNMDALAPRIDSVTRGEDGSLEITGQARWRGVSNDLITDPDLIEPSEPRFSGGYKFRLVIDGGPSLDKFAPDDDSAFDFTVSAASLGALAATGVTGSLALVGSFGPGKPTAFTAEIL